MTTTRGRVVRTQWIKRPEQRPQLESETMKNARRLPLPGPGIVITVRLDLLPAYLELHHLEPLPRVAAIGELPNPILKVTRAPARSAGERVSRDGK